VSAVEPEATSKPGFNDWFGKSKIVDEQGQPKRVYHGTRASAESESRNRFLSTTKLFLLTAIAQTRHMVAAMPQRVSWSRFRLIST
jgi:hypothetical protein